MNTPRTSTFSISQNIGHASVALINNVQDVLGLSDRTSNQYTLFDRIRNMSDEEVRTRLQTHISPEQFPQYFNAWSVIFSLMWKRMDDPDRMRKSSNCMYFSVPITTRHDKAHTLFLKSVNLNKIADGAANNPLIDNVNGIVVNSLCRSNPTIADHVMRYLTSFTIKLATDESGSRRWSIKELANVQSQECPFHLLPTPIASSPDDIYVTSVFDSVHGRPLEYLLDTEQKANLVLKALPKFCDALRTLGMHHGMMHNDMHTGNVFLDATTYKLVMIDYGMMTFPDAPALSRHVHNEKQRNYLFFTEATYSKLIEKHQSALKYSPSDSVYFTHVFDFATLMTNIAFELNKNHLWDWSNGYFEIVPAFIDRMGSYVMIPNSYAAIQREYLKTVTRITASIQDESIRSGMLLIAEGVFFMAWIQLFIHMNILKTHSDTSSSHIRVDLDDLAGEDVMHYYFQFYDLSKIEPLRIYETFEGIDTNVIANSTILQKMIMRGGKKKRTTKQKAGMIDDIDFPLRNNAEASQNDSLLMAMVENEKRRPPIVARTAPPARSAPRPATAAAPAAVYAPTVSALAGGKKPVEKSKPKKKTH